MSTARGLTGAIEILRETVAVVCAGATFHLTRPTTTTNLMTNVMTILRSLFGATLLTMAVSAAASPQSNGSGHYAMVNGLRMYYEIHGAGQPLVLIHGGGSTINTTFDRVLPLLTDKHRVIAVELQAHGRTADRNAPESFQQDADDVAELLRQLHIAKADIFGFSNGGSSALQIAIRHPERVNRLIAVSAIYKRDGLAPGFWGFFGKATFDDLPQIYKNAFLRVNPDSGQLHSMHDKDRARMLAFTDWNAEDLRSIQAPALIVVSDKDVVRPEHAVEMVHLLPHGRLVVLLGGHGEPFGEAMFPHVDPKAIEQFVGLVDRFLAGGA